jgi:hypothetical protein
MAKRPRVLPVRSRHGRDAGCPASSAEGLVARKAKEHRPIKRHLIAMKRHIRYSFGKLICRGIAARLDRQARLPQRMVQRRLQWL